MDFVLPADHRIKFKENKKKDKYLDFVMESIKLWNRKWQLYQFWLVQSQKNYKRDWRTLK